MSEAAEAETPAKEPAADPAILAVIPLKEPVNRGDTKIETITIRKPNAAALLGCLLYPLIRMDVAEMVKLLPKITEPTIVHHEVLMLSGHDLYLMTDAISDFLLHGEV